VFELATFYDYCKENAVQVIPFAGAPQPGATIRDGSRYAIFLDFSKIRSTRLLRGVCCHELSHVATGALHRSGSPYEIAERSEYRANRWAAETFLTEATFREAFAAGYTEIWQLSEYFDLPEADIRAALRYWTDSRGIDFTKQEAPHAHHD
jgi:hypothetical protein